MIVTYDLTCEGCGLKLKEVRTTPLRSPDSTPFVTNQVFGYELCNGCIDRLHQAARTMFGMKDEKK